MRKSKITVFVFLFSIFIYSCIKEKGDPIGQFSDAKLFALSKDTMGHRYLYNDPSTFLSPAGSSPHGIFKLRFNIKAQSALVAGKLPVNGSFPDSSLLVKDVYDAVNGNLKIYAVMYKLKGSWNWAEIKPDGKVMHSVYDKATVCTSCHGAATNRDLVQSFDLH